MTEKPNEDFKAVEYMRKERDRISKEIAEMDFMQIKDYLRKKRKKERILPGKPSKIKKSS